MQLSSEAPASAVRGFRRRGARLGKQVLRKSGYWARALVGRPERTAPVIVTVLIGSSAAAVGLSGLEALDEQGQLRDDLVSEVARLEHDASELRGAIAALKDDPAALELLAKAQHQLVESGEIVVLLRVPGESAVGAPDPLLAGSGPPASEAPASGAGASRR